MRRESGCSIAFVIYKTHTALRGVNVRSASNTVCIAVKLVNGVNGLLAPDALSVAELRIDELTELLALSRAAVKSLTAKVLNLEDVRDLAQ